MDSSYADEKAVTEHFDEIASIQKTIDPVAEKKLLRKLDFVILPQVTLLFLLNFIDRSAVGNAAVAGLNTDLKLSVPKYEYNIGLMLFYLIYILGEIPSNLILKKIGSAWLAVLCVCFGVISIGSGFIHNYHHFLAVRMLLGLFEGGVIPGIAFLLSRFYRRHELAFRIGVFLSLGPGLSGAFGGLIAAGLLSPKVVIGSVHTWRKIFVVEGLITTCCGLIFFFTIPTSPEKTKWLNEDERKIALARLATEQLSSPDEATKGKVVLKAILNPFTWLMTLGYIFINVIVQGTSIFLPLIISGLGKYTTVQTNLRTVPPYVVASVYSVCLSYCAWRTRRHGPFIAGSTMLSLTGYIMFVASKDPHVRYGATFLTFTGALPLGPMFLAWATSNVSGTTARAVTVAIVPAWGSIGSMVCTWIYLPKYKPNYYPGNYFNIGCSIGACLTAVVGMIWVAYENKKRAAGARDWRLEGLTEEQIVDLGHRHPKYQLMT